MYIKLIKCSKKAHYYIFGQLKYDIRQRELVKKQLPREQHRNPKKIEKESNFQDGHLNNPPLFPQLQQKYHHGSQQRLELPPQVLR